MREKEREWNGEMGTTTTTKKKTGRNEEKERLKRKQ